MEVWQIWDLNSGKLAPASALNLCPGAVSTASSAVVTGIGCAGLYMLNGASPLLARGDPAAPFLLGAPVALSRGQVRVSLPVWQQAHSLTLLHKPLS